MSQAQELKQQDTIIAAQPTAQAVLRNTSSQEGWTITTQWGVLQDYINDKGLVQDFAGYLAERSLSHEVEDNIAAHDNWIDTVVDPPRH